MNDFQPLFLVVVMLSLGGKSAFSPVQHLWQKAATMDHSPPGWKRQGAQLIESLTSASRLRRRRCSEIFLLRPPLPAEGRTSEACASPVFHPSSLSMPLASLRAWPLERDPKGVAPDYPLKLARIVVTVASTFLAWYAQQTRRQHTSVLASSAVTLACSACLDRRLGQAAFCGTFAGMSSLRVVPSASYALALGGLTSILYEVVIHSRNAFLRIGGRLGATAFIATSILTAWQNVPTGVSAWSLYSSRIASEWQQLLFSPMVLWHAAGAVATIALREASDDSAGADPVRASAVVGLLAALLLKDPVDALAVYGGSFVGMSLPSRLLYGVVPGSTRSVNVKDKKTTAKLFAAFAGAGALGGYVHALTEYLGWWQGGWGGKAGFCSFVGCLVFRGLAKLRTHFRPTR